MKTRKISNTNRRLYTNSPFLLEILTGPHPPTHTHSKTNDSNHNFHFKLHISGRGRTLNTLVVPVATTTLTGTAGPGWNSGWWLDGSISGWAERHFEQVIRGAATSAFPLIAPRETTRSQQLPPLQDVGSSARSPGGMRRFAASTALCKLTFGTSLIQRVNMFLLGASYKRPHNPKNNLGGKKCDLWSFLLDAHQFPCTWATPPGWRCPGLLLVRTAYHLSPWLQTAARRQDLLTSLVLQPVDPGSVDTRLLSDPSSPRHNHHQNAVLRIIANLCSEKTFQVTWYLLSFFSRIC